jgi:hypothetical protein
VLQLLRTELGAAHNPVWDSLDNRPRTVFRLVVAGADTAAWASLVDGAGRGGAAADPEEPITAGADPAYVHVEAGRAFAWLPGFRDARAAAPEECYELTDAVTARFSLEEMRLTSGGLLLAGLATLGRGVATEPDDVVTVGLDGGDGAVSVPAERRRRPDLVLGRGARLTRQAWAGWSATVALADLPSPSGQWRLSIGIEHHGLRRTEPLVTEPGALAGRELGVMVRRGLRVYQLRADPRKHVRADPDRVLLVGRGMRRRDLATLRATA